ncbi:hypothetical protein V8G54_006164 [Vigna mungo]|uniref:Uncharacterized protein n=1 Tax=Vigna mungo TaxID=3915 RepID=A0AAQ3S661_VIGMU
MGFRLPVIKRASKGAEIPPKGFLAVYVGDNKRRFLIPVSYLNQPTFQDLLSQSEEEFGYSHPTGGGCVPACHFSLEWAITHAREDLPDNINHSRTEALELKVTASIYYLEIILSISRLLEVPRGYLAVYVGEKLKRFLIPVSLKEPLFQEFQCRLFSFNILPKTQEDAEI